MLVHMNSKFSKSAANLHNKHPKSFVKKKKNIGEEKGCHKQRNLSLDKHKRKAFKPRPQSHRQHTSEQQGPP